MDKVFAVACGESPLGYTGGDWGAAAAEAVACGESPLGYTNAAMFERVYVLWLVGNRRSDTLLSLFHPPSYTLWLVGNRRSDTLVAVVLPSAPRLWLVGNRRSDTLSRQRATAHTSLWLVGNRRSDTLIYADLKRDSCCGLWGIAARIHFVGSALLLGRAVACGESPLGYTNNGRPHLKNFAVACGESPLGYTARSLDDGVTALWLVGNRRSDTLKGGASWLHGQLWLVGNRRSDTLDVARGRAAYSCGLWGIAARIHLKFKSALHRSCCGLWGIAARIHWRP